MVLWLGLLALLGAAGGRVYDSCDLAKELRDVYKFPTSQIATWVCIADVMSRLNTSFISFEFYIPHYLGIFGISDWKCLSEENDAPKDIGLICNVNCDKFRDDDISDDVKCIKQIYAENKKKNGDGFYSWEIPREYCQIRAYAESHMEGCRI